MQSGKVPAIFITASSIWGSAYRASNGRLQLQAGSGRSGGWSARRNDVKQYLQVQFGKWLMITKVATQGRQDRSQWVTKYTLSYSYDGVWWYQHPQVSKQINKQTIKYINNKYR